MEVYKQDVFGYVRIAKEEKRDPEKLRRMVQQGLGIEHPERIMGYTGLFFDAGDVYISKMVEEWIKYREFREFVLDSLKRFGKEDYGEISEGDDDINCENRWLGSGDRLYGRYGYRFRKQLSGKERCSEFICIRKYCWKTWITYESEPDWFLLLKDEDLGTLKDLDLSRFPEDDPEEDEEEDEDGDELI